VTAGVGERTQLPTGEMQILHSTYFILIDGNLRVRGYYSVENDSDLKKMVTDAKQLHESELKK
jgi:hypothetical protein